MADFYGINVGRYTSHIDPMDIRFSYPDAIVWFVDWLVRTNPNQWLIHASFSMEKWQSFAPLLITKPQPVETPKTQKYDIYPPWN